MSGNSLNPRKFDWIGGSTNHRRPPTHTFCSPPLTHWYTFTSSFFFLLLQFYSIILTSLLSSRGPTKSFLWSTWATLKGISLDTVCIPSTPLQPPGTVSVFELPRTFFLFPFCLPPLFPPPQYFHFLFFFFFIPHGANYSLCASAHLNTLYCDTQAGHLLPFCSFWTTSWTLICSFGAKHPTRSGGRSKDQLRLNPSEYKFLWLENRIESRAWFSPAWSSVATLHNLPFPNGAPITSNTKLWKKWSNRRRNKSRRAKRRIWPVSLMLCRFTKLLYNPRAPSNQDAPFLRPVRSV